VVVAVVRGEPHEAAFRSALKDREATVARLERGEEPGRFRR
jgi:hypothetical protein